MTVDPILAVYAVPLLAIWGLLHWRRRAAERSNVATLTAAKAEGLIEPASLHPLIDKGLCMGCGACVAACPEGDIIGLIDGKAELIEPTQCIGHGACRVACPFAAITLVFGTEARGIDIPHVDPDFQTNVPGIFIAGELGGMGLIRNAIEQGRQAIDAIARHRSKFASTASMLDVVVVGAGPAGLAATLGAKAKGLNSVTLEQDTLGGTVSHFPRAKLIMTRPAELPIVGKVRFREVTKEALLSYWQDVVDRTGIRVQFQERVEGVTHLPSGGFEVLTTRTRYLTRSVLLAIGRRGTPRKLEVPGEELSKVTYRLTDPAQYRGLRVAVVGGGDSAVEAAISLAEEPGTEVLLSYRSDAFTRLKPKNREGLNRLTASGKIDLRLKSVVRDIGETSIELDQSGKRSRVPNDAVIVCAGGLLPTQFLKSVGIAVTTKYGTE